MPQINQLGVAATTATLAGSAKARAMADFTALAGVTITDETNTVSTISGSQLTPSVTAGAINTTPFSYESADMAISTTKYVIPLSVSNSVGARSANENYAGQILFDFDGQAFEIDCICPGAASRVRVWANEQVSAWADVASATERYVKVDFGSRAPRRVMLEYDGVRSLYFAGIVAAKSDTISPTTLKSVGKLAVVGDSYDVGWGAAHDGTVAGAAADGFAAILAKRLGLFNWRMYGVGGTGYVTNANNYPTRWADVATYAPDLLVVQGSINDNGVAAATIQAAATSYLQTAKAALPRAVIVATGPLFVSTNSSYPIVSGAIAAAAAAVGVPFLETVGVGLIAGLGNVSSTTGLGNADYYQSNTPSNHPSPAGHKFWARQLAQGIAPLAGLAT